MIIFWFYFLEMYMYIPFYCWGLEESYIFGVLNLWNFVYSCPFFGFTEQRLIKLPSSVTFPSLTLTITDNIRFYIRTQDLNHQKRFAKFQLWTGRKLYQWILYELQLLDYYVKFPKDIPFDLIYHIELYVNKTSPFEGIAMSPMKFALF